MQALRLHAGSDREAVETVDIPTIGPEDVLVKVKSAGLALGLFNLVRAKMLQPLPATLGSEAAGIIDAVGKNVRDLEVGARVRVHTSVGCRTCNFCLTDRDQLCPEAGIMGFQKYGQKWPLFEKYRDGGLTEYIRAPFWLIDELPDSISFDVASK